MKKAPEELVGFITTQLNPANRMRAIPSDALLGQWSSRIARLCGEARQQIPVLFFNDTDPGSFSFYIEQWQDLLVQSMDVLYADRFKNSQDPTLALREHTLTELGALYRLLADYYPHYFNAAEKLPNWQIDGACYKLKHTEKKIRKALLEKQVDGQLVNIISEAYQEFMSPQEDVHTKSSGRLSFLNSLADTIQQFLLKEPGNYTTALRQLLMSIHFNQQSFVYYYYDRLCEVSQEEKEKNDPMDHLYHCLRTVTHTICRGPVYVPGMPTVKDQVTEWLLEDISILKKKHAPPPATAIQVQGQARRSDEEYQQLGVSVDLYSLHIRMEYEAGMLVNKNQLQMLNSIAKNCRRKNLEPVAAHSFRQGYYMPERHTRDELHKYYKRMALLVYSI